MIQELFYAGIALLLMAAALPLLFSAMKGNPVRRLSLALIVTGTALFLILAVKAFLGNTTLAFTAHNIAPFLDFSFFVDRLSSFFIATIAVVSASVAIYSVHYVESEHTAAKKNTLIALMSLFILSMLLVVSSANTFSFLFFWEAMSLSSFFLVMSEYDKKETRKAGFFYFTMTNLSTVFLMLAFFLLYNATGSFEITQIAMPAATASLAFIFLLLGFGIKAGVIPFHKWLPYAHPASPSNISALMSGVMIKVAIYGLVRFAVYVLHPVLWWGIVILIAGSVSAILGVIYALKEHDLKRLLAYHSIENIGIILMGIGLYIIFTTQQLQALAMLSLGGALFHTLNHALFKSLLFMTAGSVVSATGTRNIEEMGGLMKRMPYTALLFLIGAVAISALPPLNGFASELMIFQAILQSFAVAVPLLKILLIVCLSLLALTSALAAACFVKAFGITFLSLPRSEGAKNAREAPAFMLIGPAILAALCILAGVFSSQLFSLANYPVSTPNLSLLGILLLACMVIVVLALRSTATKKRSSETWGCGILAQDGKMEYTASGFSEPIVTIFKSVYRTRKHAQRTFFDSQGSIFKDGNAEIHLVKFFEEYLYAPIARAVDRASVMAASFQNGKLSSYMIYLFFASLAIIIILGWAA